MHSSGTISASAWMARACGSITFVERLWRSVKHEEVYLRTYDNFGNARAPLGRHFDFYKTEITHQSFDRRTPDNVYDESAAGLAA